MSIGRRQKKIIKYELKHMDKIVLGVIGFVGLILFWKGLATVLDKIDKSYPLDPVVLLFFGLVIIFLTGAMIKR